MSKARFQLLLAVLGWVVFALMAVAFVQGVRVLWGFWRA